MELVADTMFTPELETETDFGVTVGRLTKQFAQERALWCNVICCQGLLSTAA